MILVDKELIENTVDCDKICIVDGRLVYASAGKWEVIVYNHLEEQAFTNVEDGIYVEMMTCAETQEFLNDQNSYKWELETSHKFTVYLARVG